MKASKQTKRGVAHDRKEQIVKTEENINQFNL